MRKLCILWMLLAASGIYANALERNSKMGHPTEEELSMTVYEPDQEAAAVLLYSSTYLSYEIRSDEIRVVTSYKRRYKVLRQDGVDCADVAIDYYENDNVKSTRDIVSRLKAESYNMEDGKLVKTKLDGALKSDQRINKNWKQIKFSVPNVKVGSVVEYEYELISSHYTHIPTWYAQGKYPVFYTEYTTEVPEYFGFHSSVSGIYPLHSERKKENCQLLFSSGPVSCSSEIVHCWAEQLPALVDDEFMWCKEDFETNVSHEFNSFIIPGVVYKTFSSTWPDVDKFLSGDKDFGHYYRMSCPYENEVQFLRPVLDSLTVKDKVSMLRALLLSKIKWNGKYTLYGVPVKQMQKDGEAGNAALNFVLMSMLHEVGIEACPVVMRDRRRGRLPLTHPSIESLTTMVLMVKDENGTAFYVNAASGRYPIGILPAVFLTDRARILPEKGEASWVDLRGAGQGRVSRLITAKLSDDGILSGEVRNNYKEMSAGIIREQFQSQQDSADYLQRRMSSEGVTLIDYSQSGMDSGDQVIETISFSKQYESESDMYYINPFLFVDKQTPFKDETRVYPVEFAYPISEKNVITIELSDNFAVEEIPASKNLRMMDGMILCRVVTRLEGRKLNISVNFSRNSMLYTAEDYSNLREFYAQVEAACSSMLVLKKIK